MTTTMIVSIALGALIGAVLVYAFHKRRSSAESDSRYESKPVTSNSQSFCGSGDPDNYSLDNGARDESDPRLMEKFNEKVNRSGFTSGSPVEESLDNGGGDSSERTSTKYEDFDVAIQRLASNHAVTAQQLRVLDMMLKEQVAEYGNLTNAKRLGVLDMALRQHFANSGSPDDNISSSPITFD